MGSLKDEIEKRYEMMVKNNVLLTEAVFKCKEPQSTLQKFIRDNENNKNKNAEKEIDICGHKFMLLYHGARRLRYNNDLKKELNIFAPNTEIFYEYNPNPASTNIMYISKEEKEQLPYDIRDNKEIVKEALLYNYTERIQNGKLYQYQLQLCDCNNINYTFNIVSQLTPFEPYHFIVYAHNCGNLGLNQVYHYNSTVYWIDDLFRKLNCNKYSLFFTPKGTGNSLDTLHFQLIKSGFPVFGSLGKNYGKSGSGFFWTKKTDWPLEGILLRYKPEERDKYLPDFEKWIKLWLSDDANTFILLFHINDDRYHEFYFIFRKKGFWYIKGLKNEFSAFESAGKIMIEDKNDYDKFSLNIDKFELKDYVH